MKDRTSVAATILEIGGYLLLPMGVFFGLAAGAAGSGWIGALLLGLNVALGVLSLLAARWLRAGQGRGWSTGLVLCGLYLPSFFLPLGALGLWALLSAGTKRRFGHEAKEGRHNLGTPGPM